MLDISALKHFSNEGRLRNPNEYARRKNFKVARLTNWQLSVSLIKENRTQ